MSDSLYAPPRSAVADVEPAPLPRPPLLGRVVLWIWFDFLINMMLAALQVTGSKEAGEAGPLLVMVAIYVVLFALVAWINLALARGRRWTRIGYVILTVVSALGTITEILAASHGQARPWTLCLDVVSLAIEAYVTWILFTWPVRDWFRAMKARA